MGWTEILIGVGASAESLGGTDSTFWQHDLALTETLGGVDSTAWQHELELIEALGGLDSLLRQHDLTLTADALGLLDSDFWTYEWVRTEALGGVDVLQLTRDFYATEPLGVLDPSSWSVADTMSDFNALSDSIVVEFNRAASATDALGLTDSVSVVTQRTAFSDTLIGVGPIVEPLGSTDSYDATVTDTTGFYSESAGLSDSLVVSNTFERTATDAVGLTDSFSLVLERDTWTQVLIGVGAITEAAGLTEYALVETDNDPTSREVVQMSDSITVQVTVDSSYSSTVIGVGEMTELIGLSDMLDAGRERVRADSAGLTDALALSREKEVSDVSELADSTEVVLTSEENLPAVSGTTGVVGGTLGTVS